VFLGGSDITAANGVPIAASSWSPGIDLARPEGAWVICAAGKTAEVRVLEEGV
jgi:hypothetical protein